MQIDQVVGKIDFDQPEYWNSLGRTQGRSGDHQQAAVCFRRAIVLDPTHPEYRFNFGIALRHLQLIDAALMSIKLAVRKDPSWDLARTTFRSMKSERSKLQSDATANGPNVVTPTTMRVSSGGTVQLDFVKQFKQQATELKGKIFCRDSELADDMAAANELIAEFDQRLPPFQANDYFRSLAQQRQDKGVQKDSVLLLAIAQRLLGMGTPRRMGSRSLGKQNWTTIADFLAVEQIARAVTTDFTENLTGDSLDAGLRLASRCLARTLRFQGRQEEAIRIFDALDLADDDAVAEGSSIDFQMLGSDLLLDLGRTDEAKERLCRALTLEADIGQAHFMLAKFGGSDRPNHLGQLNEILAGPEKAPAVTSALHCARGLLLEHEGDFEQAFDSFLAAGEAKQRNIEKLGAPEAVFKLDELKSVFDADFFADRHGWGRRDTTPIFIVGLPRSGTTLTEQILASHSQIAGAGELPDIAIIHRRLLGDACGDPIATGRFGDVTAEATERAAQLHSRSLTALHAAPIRSGVKHVVDKMPTNFIHLGTIAMLFPNAKIIHCRRELRDIGISCLKNNLAWPYCHPDGFTPLANDYVKLMQHWHETLPLKIFDLDYESMVDDLDSTVHRLLEFCGVPFEESCLEFHNNTRPVRTPTRGQVRSPIYKTSVAAWRRYEAQLQAKGFDAFCELEH